MPINRSEKVSAFLWDVDGTIVDSRKFAYTTTNDVLKELGKRTYTQKEFRELFSSDYKIHIKHMGVNSEQEENFLRDTWNARLIRDRHKFHLYSGIPRVLKYLHQHNYKMALVSSSSRLHLHIYFDMFALNKFFPVIISREDVDEQKPSTKPILKATEQLNVSPSDCVLIDDAADGIEAAKKLGATTIGVTWGFNSSKRIIKAEPDFIAHTRKELYRTIIEKLGC